jgi:two-component sensor histidine kinase
MTAYAAWAAGTASVLALCTWLVVRTWERRVIREVARERDELSALQAQRDAAEAAKRSADAQRVILLHEVNHRARNALTVAQSLVNLTLADDPGRGTEVSARIGALAGAYGLLSENEWQGASLPAIVSRALAAFAGPYVTAEGPPIRVGPACVQPLSMLLHELATNACKHGSLSTAGRVAIAWRESGEHVLLTWEETGGPPITDLPQREGVGSRVIEAVVGKQLDGQITREWKDSGLVVTVSMARETLLANAEPDALRRAPLRGALAG